jgi:hypothetical protein
MAATLLSASGQRAHRTGFHRLALGQSNGVGFAASCGRLHWLDQPYNVGHGHGSVGALTEAGTVLVVCLVRSGRELRLVRLEQFAPAEQGPAEQGAAEQGAAEQGQDLRLIVSGWPVPPEGPAAVRVSPVACQLPSVGLGPDYVLYPAKPGLWAAALVDLSAETAVLASVQAKALIEQSVQGLLTITVTWPDSTETTTTIQLAQPLSPVGAAQTSGLLAAQTP